MKKVLLTGGAGLIGSRIADILVKKGDKVTVLDNLSTGSLENLREIYNDLEFIEGDIEDSELLKKLVQKKDTVYHLAAELGVDKVANNDTRVSELDYLASVRLFNASVKVNVETLLFASTSEVYGRFPQYKLPMKENDMFTPDTVYGWAKFGAELKLKEITEKSETAGVIARYFNVYGPNQSLTGFCVPHFIQNSLTNQDIKIHGDGSQTRDLTYVDDSARMTIAIAKPKYKGEVFNIGSQIQVTMLDLANFILNFNGSSSKIKFIEPRRPTDLYHKMGDASKIYKATGIKPKTSLKDGLRECILYSVGKLK